MVAFFQQLLWQRTKRDTHNLTKHLPWNLIVTNLDNNFGERGINMNNLKVLCKIFLVKICFKKFLEFLFIYMFLNLNPKLSYTTVDLFEIL